MATFGSILSSSAAPAFDSVTLGAESKFDRVSAGVVSLTRTDTTGATFQRIVAGAAGQQAGLELYDDATSRWRIYKETTNQLRIRDMVSSKNAVSITPASSATGGDIISLDGKITLYGAPNDDFDNTRFDVAGELDSTYNQVVSAKSSRARFDCWTDPGVTGGTNGIRNRGAGTIQATSATAVVGTGTAFSGASHNGKKITAVIVTGSDIAYYTATVSSVTNATNLTLSGAGFGTTLPAGTSYAIDPDSTAYVGAATGTDYCSFFAAVKAQCTDDGYGSFSALDIQGTINDAAAGGSDGYGEVAAIGAHVFGNRQGAWLGAAEFGTSVYSGKQARAVGVFFALQEANSYPSYNDTAIFGAGSAWLQSGSRGIWVKNQSTGQGGTGIYISNQAGFSSFKRAMVICQDETTDIFCIDGTTGYMGLGGATTNQTLTIPARLTIEGTAGTVAHGIQFGLGSGSANLYRSANDTVKTDDFFHFGSSAWLTSTSGFGFLSFAEQTSAVAIPTSNTHARVYVKADKLVIHFNQGGTEKYYTLPLTSATGTDAPAIWTATQTAP